MSRAIRLGAFIVVTLAVLGVGVFIIGSNEYLFRSTYRLNTQFSNVAGLTPGADVQVGGVHSGTVRSILLPRGPGQRITVVVDLDKTTHEIIKKDSIAAIETQGLLGNQYLSISFGSAGQPEVNDGDTIASVAPLEMSALLKEASGILDSSQEAVENVTVATGHLKAISAKIDSGQGTVGELVNDKTLYNNLESTTGNLRETVIHAQSGVTDFQENMEALKHNFLLRGYFKSRGYESSADLAADEIDQLPPGAPLKTFDYSAKDLFDKQDSAKLKHEKSLNDGGQFLAGNEFGCAVIEVDSGMEGDSQRDLVLTQARAMVIRNYLVEHFAFDDSQLKTMGQGKKAGSTANSGGWGSVHIVIYPPGVPVPQQKQPDDSSSGGDAAKSASVNRTPKQ
jgi:phospholipid/cholesterol/gamma-HCH transport system substrate-binding protein